LLLLLLEHVLLLCSQQLAEAEGCVGHHLAVAVLHKGLQQLHQLRS
jgi:hypothetical protein